MRLDHSFDKSVRKGRQPSMSLAEFAISRGIGRQVVRSRVKLFPLPAPSYYGSRNNREVAFYSIASLDKWYREWKDVQPPRGRAS